MVRSAGVEPTTLGFGNQNFAAHVHRFNSIQKGAIWHKTNNINMLYYLIPRQSVTNSTT